MCTFMPVLMCLFVFMLVFMLVFVCLFVFVCLVVMVFVPGCSTATTCKYVGTHNPQ